MIKRWPTRLVAAAALVTALPAAAQPAPGWQMAGAAELAAGDDDFRRHGEPDFFVGLEISTLNFTENGFAWQLVRFRNPAKPDGPLWVVPHDDEDGAFDAMIAALRAYGGVGIAVNSTGARRNQSGSGRCGPIGGLSTACDPNRNFAAATPLYTLAFLDQRGHDQPVIALHTNRPGFSGDGRGGSGDISIVDEAAFRRGTIAPRSGALLALAPAPAMANYDTFGLAPFSARAIQPSPDATRCGRAIAADGIAFWHERVGRSDGSLSNYIALNRPEIAYFNAESRAEADPAIAAARHALIISAYLRHCMADNPQSTSPMPAEPSQGEKTNADRPAP